jgi:hypothetical protein
MRRVWSLAIGTLLATAALAGVAFAKEGAVSRLDPLPPGGLHAGANIPIGFTILMDGVQPYKADVAEIVIRNGTGKVLSYPATPDGPAGHYVAKVYFPAAGTYTWQVIQGSVFPPYDLGSITVLAPASAGADGAAQTTPASAPVEPLPMAIGFAAMLIALGGTIRLARLVRMQRRTVAA